MATEADIDAGITALVRDFRPDAEVAPARRVLAGASSEIWAVDASWSENDVRAEYPLIIRRAAETEFESAGREAEYCLLRSLYRNGVPVPRTYAFDGKGRFLGRPAMILERSQGQADRGLLTGASKVAPATVGRLKLAREIVDRLADIHSLDPDSLDLSPASRQPGDPAACQLALYDAETRRLEVDPMPELRLASLWLHDHLPEPPRRLSLVHGDYRPANLLIDDGRISAILDWEFGHVGDPAEDLGWYLSPYYAAEHLIAGEWRAEDVIARYEARRGIKIDPAAIRFWSVFAMYKLASITLSALRDFAGGDITRMAPSADFVIEPLLMSLDQDA